MRFPPRRPAAAATALTVGTMLSVAALASAGQITRLLAPSTPLPPATAANPSGRLTVLSPAERSITRRGIGRSRLAVPSVGIDAHWALEPLSGQQLVVPTDVHVTGLWAGGGSILGGRGTVLIDGHINYVGQGDGALFPLASVRPGALIGTSTRTGRTVWWRAVRIIHVAKVALPQGIFTSTGPHRLVIVTCGGTLETDGHYDQNVVLSARPVVATGRPHRVRVMRSRGSHHASANPGRVRGEI